MILIIYLLLFHCSLSLFYLIYVRGLRFLTVFRPLHFGGYTAKQNMDGIINYDIVWLIRYA
jgi:hypothetical protein